LLEESGAPLTWNTSAANGRGAYRLATLGRAQTAGTTTQFSRYGTQFTAHTLSDNDLVQANEIEKRLVHGLEQGGMLVLTVHTRIARHAETELLHRFGTPDVRPAPLKRVNFDAMLLTALREQAQKANADWNIILQADAAGQGTKTWSTLQRAVQRTLPALRSALLNSPAPLLLVNAGLLARYDLIGLVTELEEHTGRPGHTPSLWLLLPSSRHQGLPMIDGVAVPMVNNIHNTRALALPQAWIENKHRAKTATAGRATT
jgi:hypothetical protein